MRGRAKVGGVGGDRCKRRDVGAAADRETRAGEELVRVGRG